MSVRLSRARTEQDWRAAAELLAEYLGWLSAVGIDLAAAQPAAGPEFEDMRRYYRPPEGALIVARIANRPVGMVGVRRLAGSLGELKRMYTSPAARGRGLGRILVAEAVTAANELGFTELRLQTKPGLMPAAHRLYHEFGFAEVTPYGGLAVEDVATLGLDLAGVCAVT
jgi:GNAT superfamily N-acetyltransferase